MVTKCDEKRSLKSCFFHIKLIFALVLRDEMSNASNFAVFDNIQASFEKEKIFMNVAFFKNFR